MSESPKRMTQVRRSYIHGVNPIDFDRLIDSEVEDIRLHFAKTSDDFFIGVWPDGIEMYVTRARFLNWHRHQFTKRSSMKNIGKPNSIESSTSAPNCRTHSDQKMHYDPQEDKFVCPVRDCTVEARRRVKKSDFKGVVITGEFELVKTSEDKFFLYNSKTDTMIDITTLVEINGTGRIQNAEDWVLMLRFPGIRKV